MWCQNPEEPPLLVDEEAGNAAQEHGCAKSFSLFSFFCFLSGQYINVSSTRKGPSKCNIISVTGFVLFLGQLFLHLSHVIIAMVVESYRFGNISHCITTIDNTVRCSLPQEQWTFSYSILIGTFAGLVSHYFFTIVLIRLSSSLSSSSSLSKCGISYNARNALQNNGLSQFDNYSAVNFCCEYVSEHILFVIGFLSFVVYPLAVYYYDNQELGHSQDSCWITILKFGRFFLYFNLEFCAIQRCFMFFKIVDKITFKLSKLTGDFDQVDFPEHSHNVYVQDNKMIHELIESKDKEKVDKGRYYWLQKIDQEFIHHVQPTLALLGVWFIFHWILYTITTALASAALIEAAIDFVRFNIRLNDSYVQHVLMSVVPFTLIHFDILLCPLYYAASISSARAKLINDISKRQWSNTSLTTQTSFVQYLSLENFAFKVPFFGTQVTVDSKAIVLTFLLISISTVLILIFS